MRRFVSDRAQRTQVRDGLAAQLLGAKLNEALRETHFGGELGRRTIHLGPAFLPRMAEHVNVLDARVVQIEGARLQR